MKLLHKIIFWSHLLAGIISGVVIFIMSATGVILMYEHQMVEYAERDVREVVAPGANARRLSLDEIVARRARKIRTLGRLAWFCETNPPLRSQSDSVAKAQPTSIPITEMYWAEGRSCTTGFTMSSIGTAGSAWKAKAVPPAVPSPARAISLSSGLPSPASISGGRAVGTGAA